MQTLDQILQKALQQLQFALLREDAWEAFASIFELPPTLNRELLLQQLAQLAQGSSRPLPRVQVVVGPERNWLGAYDKAQDRILINQGLWEQASERERLAMMLEELGHAIEVRLTPQDAPWDEGEAFCRWWGGGRGVLFGGAEEEG